MAFAGATPVTAGPGGTAAAAGRGPRALAGCQRGGALRRDARGQRRGVALDLDYL